MCVATGSSRRKTQCLPERFHQPQTQPEHFYAGIPAGSEALVLGSKSDRVPLETSASGNKDRRSEHILSLLSRSHSFFSMLHVQFPALFLLSSFSSAVRLKVISSVCHWTQCVYVSLSIQGLFCKAQSVSGFFSCFWCRVCLMSFRKQQCSFCI